MCDKRKNILTLPVNNFVVDVHLIRIQILEQNQNVSHGIVFVSDHGPILELVDKNSDAVGEDVLPREVHEMDVSTLLHVVLGQVFAPGQSVRWIGRKILAELSCLETKARLRLVQLFFRMALFTWMM